MRKITSIMAVVSVFNFFRLFAAGGDVIQVETRGVWVDKSDVYKGEKYLTEMFDKLTTANFNAVYLPVQYKGYVIYPDSKYLPQDPDVAKFEREIYGKLGRKEDEKMRFERSTLKWMIDEAHKRRLHVEAWPEYGFYAYHTRDARSDPSRGPLLDKNPELTSIDINGQPYLHHPQWGDFYSLCPSNPESHEIMINVLCEAITRYDFDGLNLDRIRYPAKDFCFCPYCKEHFQKDTGFELTKENIEKEEVKKAFYEWRKKQVNKFMEKLSEKVRLPRPALLISAYVWTPEEIDAKGQDWPTWVKKGYIDVVIPGMYFGEIEAYIDASKRIIPNPRLMLCGISAEVNSSEKLAEQIELVRKKNASGVVVWYLGKAADDLDYLKSTVFKTPAKPYIPERIKKLKVLKERSAK